MKALIEIIELTDVITTSAPTIIWGDGNVTPPTKED